MGVVPLYQRSVNNFALKLAQIIATNRVNTFIQCSQYEILKYMVYR